MLKILDRFKSSGGMRCAHYGKVPTDILRKGPGLAHTWCHLGVTFKSNFTLRRTVVVGELPVGPAASPLPVLRLRARPGFGVALRSRRERARPGPRGGHHSSAPRAPRPARHALDPDVPEGVRATGGEGGGATGGQPTP